MASRKQKPPEKMDFIYLADREDAIPLIAEWYFEQWHDRIEANSVAETARRLHNYLNRDEIPLIVLAVHSEEILGVAQLKYYEMDIYPEKEHWLGGVFVAPKHRGQGVAARLVKKMIEIARSLGVKTLHLQTDRLDGGLYARLGWRPVEIVRYRDLEVLAMKKDL